MFFFFFHGFWSTFVAGWITPILDHSFIATLDSIFCHVRAKWRFIIRASAASAAGDTDPLIRMTL